MKKSLVFLTVVLLFVHVFTGFGVTPGFQGLGDLDGSLYHSYATDISGDGSTVVGISYASTGFQTFRWTSSEGIVAVNDLVSQTEQSSTFPRISRDGSTIVGQVGNEAARWTAAEGVQSLGVLGGIWRFSSTATGVSADGSIVVGYSTNTGVDNEAFRWNETNGMQGMGFFPDCPIPESRAFAISDNGSVVVGEAFYYHPIIGDYGNGAAQWTADGGIMPLIDTQGNFIAAAATDVSADGSVIVGYGSGPTPWQAFRWTSANNIEPLGYLDDSLPGNSYAWGISGNGEVIVGHCQDRAFIWDENNGMRSVQDLLISYGLDLSGWDLYTAYSASFDGTTIVGTGWNPDGNLEAWVATIPEPTSAILLVVGAGLLRVSKRKR